MADAYDGDIPKQKLAYFSPILAGFTLGVSCQPGSVGLNNSGALTNSGATGSAQVPAFGAQSRDRIKAALASRHAFAPVAIKANLGYAHAGVSRSVAALAADGAYRDVDLLNAGAVLNYAGFELEGSVNTGHFAYNCQDSGSPFGPCLRGARAPRHATWASAIRSGRMRSAPPGMAWISISAITARPALPAAGRTRGMLVSCAAWPSAAPIRSGRAWR